MKFLTLIGFLGCFATVSAFAEVSLISVTGVATKSVDPDIVNLQVEIWSRSPQAKVAQETVAKEYARIKALTEKFKIKKEDFQTQAYNLNPEMDYSAKGGARPIGYRASHSLFITHRKVDEAGQLIDALSSAGKVDSGGVIIQNINWDFDKRRQVELSLLADAVENAKKQADELAKASGSKIKGPYRLNYSVMGTPPMPVMAKMRTEAMDMASSTEVSGGPVKIQVQVQAEYQIQ